MSELTHGLKDKVPRYANAIKWVKLISITGGAQAIIQAINLISGIIIIRSLSTQEYALYILANTMLSSVTLLSDGGIGTSAMALGGQAWQSKRNLGVVLQTGLQLKRKFSTISIIVILPILLYLLRLHNAGWLTSILIILCLIPAFIAALSDSLLEIPLKLHQDIKGLQQNQLLVSGFRFFLLCLSIFLFPFTYVALLTSSIPRIWGNFRLQKQNRSYSELKATPDPVIRAKMLKTVKRMLPEIIFYCLSGQITIWIISIFGSTNSLAQIGALGRISAVLALFSIMFNTLIQPRFARLPNDKNMLLSFFIKVFIGMCSLSAILVLLVWLFSSQILWILGSHYSGLNYELVLCMFGSCLNTLIAGSAFNLNLSRAWIINPVLVIIINICTIVIGVIFIDITSLRGVLTLNIFTSAVLLITNVSYILIKIRGTNS